MSIFYDERGLEKIALQLICSWGYRFYRVDNQLRMDDQLIRSNASQLLGSARKSVENAEREYRREFLPPPSREKPRHDPAAVASAQALERLSKGIGTIQGLITAQPVPENDRTAPRGWNEAGVLAQLGTCDQKLVGQAEVLRAMIDQKNGAWLLENRSALEEGLNALRETLRQRQSLLFPAL